MSSTMERAVQDVKREARYVISAVKTLKDDLHSVAEALDDLEASLEALQQSEAPSE